MQIRPKPASSLLSILFALMPAHAPALAQTLPAGCEVQLLSTLPVVFENGLPTVEGKINGQPLRMLVDTGITVTTLSKPAAEKLGIPVITSESTYAGINVMNAQLDSFAVGPFDRKGWFVVDEYKNTGADLRLGANILFGTDVEIFLAQQQLKFFSSKGCFRAKLAYWDQSAASVKLEIDPRKRDLRPWFMTRINGKDIPTVLSTKSEHSYLDRHTAARAGITPELPDAQPEQSIVGWREKTQPVWSIPLTAMSIGGMPVPDFKIRLVNLDLSGEILVLGRDFLLRHRVYVAKGQGRVYFTPVAAAAAGPG
jgi:predicted aspartyl protease